MSNASDKSLLFLETISSSLRVIESIGDTVYADQGISEETKKQIDHLIVQLNKIFKESIRKIEEYD
jgi:predicted metalloendopeptidase